MLLLSLIIHPPRVCCLIMNLCCFSFFCCLSQCHRKTDRHNAAGCKYDHQYRQKCPVCSILSGRLYRCTVLCCPLIQLTGQPVRKLRIFHRNLCLILRLCIMGFSYAISAFMDCTIAASRGLGKTVVPTVIVIMGSCVFRVIWVYTIFAHFHTIPSLYLLYPCSWTLTAIAEIVYFIHAYKDSMKIFTQLQPAEV